MFNHPRFCRHFWCPHLYTWDFITKISCSQFPTINTYFSLLEDHLNHGRQKRKSAAKSTLLSAGQ